jgi:hypothetical protein
LAVASSRVAAISLHGGRIAHFALKLPLNFNLTEDSTCNIIDNPATCKLLKRTKVIVWNECRIVNKKGPEALHRTLQDNNKSIMRKVVVILAGDFRQTLSIITRATPADQIDAYLKNSYFWKHTEIIMLKKI